MSVEIAILPAKVIQPALLCNLVYESMTMMMISNQHQLSEIRTDIRHIFGTLRLETKTMRHFLQQSMCLDSLDFLLIAPRAHTDQYT